MRRKSIILLALFLAGCGATPETTEGTRGEWSNRAPHDASYEISFPDSWIGAQDILDDPSLWDAKFAGTSLEGQKEGGLTVFDAYAEISLLNTATTIEGSIETFNLLPYLAYDNTLDNIRETAKTNLETGGARDVALETRTVAGHETLVIDYRKTDMGFSTSRQYYIIAQDKLWVFIFSGNNRSDTAHWDEIIESFTLKS